MRIEQLKAYLHFPPFCKALLAIKPCQKGVFYILSKPSARLDCFVLKNPNLTRYV